jgi:hypothetical protein
LGVKLILFWHDNNLVYSNMLTAKDDTTNNNSQVTQSVARNPRSEHDINVLTKEENFQCRVGFTIYKTENISQLGSTTSRT